MSSTTTAREVRETASGAPSRSDRLRGWLMRPPVVIDVVLAGFVTLLGLVSLGAETTASAPREVDLLGVVLVLLSGLPVVVRSRVPVAAFVVTLAASLATFALGYPQTNGGIGALFCLYSVAALTARRTSLPVGVGALLVIGSTLVLAPVPGVGATDVAVNLLAAALFWGAGAWSRSRRQYVRGLEERNAALVSAQELRARAALVEARGAVAREMQDLLGHNVMAMTVQATAARRMLTRDPDAADRLLADVEMLGRSAVQEVGRVLGLLGDPEEPVDTRPQPGIDQVESLVDDARRAGLDVRLERSGLDSTVDGGPGLTVYRVVEEALQNAEKHAGRARVVVRLVRRADAVEVTVTDDGRGQPSWRAGESAPGTGIGMLSLAQRVESYGGSLRAGPRRGGGFVVEAVVPTASRG
ncbi:MAG: sensor histidine kinase [Actinomycetes bacterium]